jgi:hypothetical protein
MTNKMLEELRRMAESGNTLPVDAALRLILASQADNQEALNTTQKTIEGVKIDVSDLKDSRQDRDKDYTHDYESTQDQFKILRKQMEELSNKIQSIRADLEKFDKRVLNNLALDVGIFVKEHPKLALAILVGVLLIANLWFISGFRQGILQWIGVPSPIIDLLNPTGIPMQSFGTPTPTHVHFWELTPGVYTPPPLP